MGVFTCISYDMHALEWNNQDTFDPKINIPMDGKISPVFVQRVLHYICWFKSIIKFTLINNFFLEKRLIYMNVTKQRPKHQLFNQVSKIRCISNTDIRDVLQMEIMIRFSA